MIEVDTDMFDDLEFDDRTDEQRRVEHNKGEMSKLLDKDLVASITAATNKLYMQSLGYIPKKMKSAVYLPNIQRKHDVGSAHYVARLSALCYILRNPEVASKRTVYSTAWSEVTTLPYYKQLWGYGIMPTDVTKIRAIANEAGVKLAKRVDCQSVIASALTKHHSNNEARILALQEENELLKALTPYEFVIDHDNNALLYKNYILNWSAKHRAYYLVIGGQEIKITSTTVQKFVQALDTLDNMS